MPYVWILLKIKGALFLDMFPGDIFLNHDLDREKVSSYRLPVSAVSVDNPGDRITTDVIINVIDVNDYTPEFEKVIIITNYNTYIHR